MLHVHHQHRSSLPYRQQKSDAEWLGESCSLPYRQQIPVRLVYPPAGSLPYRQQNSPCRLGSRGTVRCRIGSRNDPYRPPNRRASSLPHRQQKCGVDPERARLVRCRMAVKTMSVPMGCSAYAHSPSSRRHQGHHRPEAKYRLTLMFCFTGALRPHQDSYVHRHSPRHREDRQDRRPRGPAHFTLDFPPGFCTDLAVGASVSPTGSA